MRAIAGQTTSHCTTGWNPGLAIACSISQPRTRMRPRSGARNTSEHREIQLYVINAQRAAAIALRDAGEINDETLRELERELDLEELRMEA